MPATTSTRATRSSTRQTKSTTAATTKKTTKKKAEEDPVEGDVRINPRLPFLRPSIRIHDPALVEHNRHPTAQEIANDEGDQADGQVDQIQAVRVPRSGWPPRQCSDAPLVYNRNDVSDNVDKDLNGYVHLHVPLCHTAFVRRTHPSNPSATG